MSNSKVENDGRCMKLENKNQKYSLPSHGQDWSVLSCDNLLMNLKILRLMKKASIQSNGRKPVGWSFQQIAVEFNKAVMEARKKVESGMKIPAEFLEEMPLERVTCDDGKISKEECKYGAAVNQKAICANCRYFKGVNVMECELVEGLVESQDVCMLWDPGFHKVKEYKEKRIIVYFGYGFQFSVQA